MTLYWINPKEAINLDTITEIYRTTAGELLVTFNGPPIGGVSARIRSFHGPTADRLWNYFKSQGYKGYEPYA